MSEPDLTDFPNGPGDPFARPAPGRPELVRNGRYYLPPLGDPTGKPTPRTRVTNFVKAVSDMYTLDRWHQREVAIGLAFREDLYDLLRTLDVNDKDAVQKITDQALEAAKSGRIGLHYGKGGSDTGSALHAHTDQLDRGMPVTARSHWAPKLANYEKAMADACLHVVPGMIELRVVVERFNLAGTFDRVLGYAEPSTGRNPLFIGDLKTQRVFYTWWEIAMQLALYANADAIWDPDQCRFLDMPPVSREMALVFHMPMVHDGDDPHRVQPYEVDIAVGWEACQLVANVRELRSKGKSWGIPFQVLTRPLSDTERYAARIRDAAARPDLVKINQEMTKHWSTTTIPVELLTAGRTRWEELTS